MYTLSESDDKLKTLIESRTANKVETNNFRKANTKKNERNKTFHNNQKVEERKGFRLLHTDKNNLN